MNTHRTIESFRIDAIKDVPLPSAIAGLPFQPDELRTLLEKCPAIFTDPGADQDSLPFTHPNRDVVDDFYLQQPSTMHKRSFEIIKNGKSEMWADEYGNTYGALTLKGNNFSKPGIVEHPTASEGYIAYGLQESSIIERVLRASEVLRSRNIPTEYTIGVAEPKQYPWPLLGSQADAYEMISLKEYKRRIVDNYWQDLPDQQQTPQALADLYAKFQDMTFYISLRATDTAYRLHDMSDRASRSKVFAIINEQGYLPEDCEPLNAASSKDIDRYLEQVFGPLSGRNYARLHVDLSHGFAHGYNMSALGSIVDLDSIRGPAIGLGDEEISHKDRARDLMDVIAAIDGLGHINLTNDYISNASLAFVDSYISETIAQQDDLSAALDQLNDVFTTLAAGMRQSDSILRRYNANHLFAYVNARLSSELEPLITREQIEAYNGRALLCIHDVIGGETTNRIIEEHFISQSDRYVDDLLDEYVNEITGAVSNHEEYDVYLDIERSIDMPSSYVGRMIINHILEVYISEFEQRFSLEMNISDAQMPNMASSAILRNILNQYNDDLRSIATAKAKQLLPLLHDIIKTESKYSVAEPFIKNDSTYANIGLNDCHLWLSTEGVSLTELLPHIEQLTGELIIEELSTHETSPQTVIHPVNAPDRIDEIISDACIDGWEEDEHEGRRVMNIFYTSSPAYLLIRKTLKSGGEQLRLQLPAESLRLIREDNLSLREIIPAFMQGELF